MSAGAVGSGVATIMYCSDKWIGCFIGILVFFIGLIFLLNLFDASARFLGY